MEQVFLSSRILFLVTLKPTPFLRKAVEGLGLIDALAMVRGFLSFPIDPSDPGTPAS
jgi:hypothetical protein